MLLPLLILSGSCCCLTNAFIIHDSIITTCTDTLSSTWKRTHPNKHNLILPSPSFPIKHSPTQLNNFFKDLLDSAFENDPNLSPNKSEQQLEGPNDDNTILSLRNKIDNEKTDVQKRWLASQAKLSSNNSNTQSSTTFSPSLSSSSSSATVKGAPINPVLLFGTKWELSLYLTGIPDFDPNNSLYGSKVNISTRKDSNMAKDGFAIGCTLPPEPSTTATIQFLDNGICKVSDGSFTNSIDGEWKLSDDGKMIRFSMDVKGYQRTVTTTGTIQNVYWTDREDVERKSSATYSIDAGKVYGEASVGYGSKPGIFVLASGGSSADPGGILKVEQKTGMFGINTKMLACGKFCATMITRTVDTQE